MPELDIHKDKNLLLDPADEPGMPKWQQLGKRIALSFFGSSPKLESKGQDHLVFSSNTKIVVLNQAAIQLLSNLAKTHPNIEVGVVLQSNKLMLAIVDPTQKQGQE